MSRNKSTISKELCGIRANAGIVTNTPYEYKKASDQIG